MSESKRSFFSTIPGLITGLAGLLTGIVGLVTVLIQLGVLGGDDSSSSSPGTTVTSAPAPGGQGAVGGGGSGGTTATDAPTFTVSPTTLDFQATDPRTKRVTVENTSSTASIRVTQPRVTGEDASNFSVSLGQCSGALAPNLSCTIEVTFAPSGPLRRYTATLQVQATGAPRGDEVRLTGSSLLG
ncbi:MAG TPA: hypothetical protein VHF91_08370 [Acidimicrobiales bacterium]|nr:hypothetical protein [Acidimicrobiales bacterium]